MKSGWFDRAGGILLHPTSLPGPHGIGDLGSAAHRFVDFLADAGLSLWQVLPVGPTGYGDSPYASFSTFAGNPLLVSLEKLVEDGSLRAADIDPPGFPADRVDFGRLIPWKLGLLDRAARRFLSSAAGGRRAAFDRFCAAEKAWLDDYALFTAVKARHDGRARATGRSGSTAWNAWWDRDIAAREREALARWAREEAEAAAAAKVVQHWFFSQWQELRAHAAEHRIRIVGDVPIFVAPDSADVWAEPRLFLLDRDRRPTVVSGVPPDYFSATGQLWGNPIYDWRRMAREGFAWWIGRFRSALRFFDAVRVDHFRGFAAYWEVPAGEPTAVHGRWVPAPGRRLFEAVRRALGSVPLVAEDLGVITPDVTALREQFDFPGMIVLQFAFDAREAGGLDELNRFLPHNHREHSVVYTGTHDNDTTAGWFAERTPAERGIVARYLGGEPADVPAAFIRLAMASVARWAVVPMQDVLGLGTEARMNLPASSAGNWAWRARGEAFGPEQAGRLRELAMLYGRTPRNKA
jgi:4-alpha-glucanotransferase